MKKYFYELVRIIGIGGFGVVMESKNTKTNEQAAIKLISIEEEGAK